MNRVQDEAGSFLVLVLMANRRGSAEGALEIKGCGAVWAGGARATRWVVAAVAIARADDVDLLRLGVVDEMRPESTGIGAHALGSAQHDGQSAQRERNEQMREPGVAQRLHGSSSLREIARSSQA